MKKYKSAVLIAVIAMMLSTGLYADGGAGAMFIAPKVDLAYGFGDAHDYKISGQSYAVNPGFGGGFFFGYYYNDSFAMEGDVSFLYWLTEAPKDITVTHYAVPFYLGIKLAMNPMFGIIAGGGAQWSYNQVEVDGGSSATEKKLWSSFYAGVEVNFQSVLFRPKFVYVYHTTDPSYSIWFELGYRFDLQQG